MSLKCDECGRFIAYKDIEDGVAIHHPITPDSDYTNEYFETLCKLHTQKSIVECRHPYKSCYSDGGLRCDSCGETLN